MKTYDTMRFASFQGTVFDEMRQAGATWGIGKYLEERRVLLENYPQIFGERRYFHAGLDVIVPAGYRLLAPIDGTVEAIGVEEGMGNYGGYVLLRHVVKGTCFYSLYGHLSVPHTAYGGQHVRGGEIIGHVGGQETSGGWFTHTHVQILTSLAVQEGLTLCGYVAEQDLRYMDRYFPSPYHIFRF